MGLQVGHPLEGALADAAAERVRRFVDQHVDFQSMDCEEPFVTVGAG